MAHTSVNSRHLDFWLLGGASIVVWAIMAGASLLRAKVPSLEQHFLQLPATFALLAVVCNQPHFLISYRFGYGRGGKFIAAHWLSLIIVPLFIVFFYGLAFQNFNTVIDSDNPVIRALNSFFESLDIGYRVGKTGRWGAEIMSSSIWLMYLTVGWHYSKQVFGIMMVYAKFDNYPLSSLQRRFIKLTVFGVAFSSFFSLSIADSRYQDSSEAQISYFGIPLTKLGLPSYLLSLSLAFTILSALGLVFFVFYKNKKQTGKLPSLNFLTPLVAFCVWWLPPVRNMEFFLLAAPFFHSLQYLPFAFKMEFSSHLGSAFKEVRNTAIIFLVVLVGFLAFEFFPNMLDEYLETSIHQIQLFFAISIPVFINIHHFFIDSVVWKFNQTEVRHGLF